LRPFFTPAISLKRKNRRPRLRAAAIRLCQGLRGKILKLRDDRITASLLLRERAQRIINLNN
jgi:hypothetical protein